MIKIAIIAYHVRNYFFG